MSRVISHPGTIATGKCIGIEWTWSQAQICVRCDRRSRRKHIVHDFYFMDGATLTRMWWWAHSQKQVHVASNPAMILDFNRLICLMALGCSESATNHCIQVPNDIFLCFCIRFLLHAFCSLLIFFSCQPVEGTKTVNQFHFISWPDHDVPQYATAFLNFMKRVNREHPKDRGPMIVHCRFVY